MLDDAQKTEHSLNRTNRACKFICTAMKVVFVLLCIWWCFSIAVICCSLFNPEILNNAISVNIYTLLIYSVSVAIMVVTCITLIRMFSDASKGDSPFTLLQVRRLRLIAVALVFYAVLEFAMSYNAMCMQQSWMNSSASGEITTINVFPLIAAAVVFAFSFVFKYGVLLQKLSDETL